MVWQAEKRVSRVTYAPAVDMLIVQNNLSGIIDHYQIYDSAGYSDHAVVLPLL